MTGCSGRIDNMNLITLSYKDTLILSKQNKNNWLIDLEVSLTDFIMLAQ